MNRLAKSLDQIGVQRQSQLTQPQRDHYFELNEMFQSKFNSATIWDIFVQSNYDMANAIEFLFMLGGDKFEDAAVAEKEGPSEMKNDNVLNQNKSQVEEEKKEPIIEYLDPQSSIVNQ